jgi:hypothetical protein
MKPNCHLFLVVVLSTISMLAFSNPSKTNAVISSTEGESLESLRAKVDRLRKAPRNWQTGYLCLAGVTVLVGGLMLVSQYMQTRAASALERAQSALSNEQDRLRVSREEAVAKDLRDKDLALEELRKNNLATETHLLEANTALERERQDRLRLEQQTALSLQMESQERDRLARGVADRFASPNQLRQMLERFAGTRVLVEYTVNDPEVRRVADEIVAGLEWAHWKGPRSEDAPGWASELVVARPLSRFREMLGGPFETGIMVGVPADNRPAGMALLGALRELGIHDVRHVRNFWEPSAVYVLVGLKPGLIVLP